MTLNERVEARLNEGLDGLPDLDVREDGSRPPATYFDLFVYPGQHDGKTWEVLLPVCVEDGAVTVEEVSIHAGTGGDFDYVATLDGDGMAGVPASVLDVARDLRRQVEDLALTTLSHEGGSPAP